MRISKAFFEKILSDFLSNKRNNFLCELPDFSEFWAVLENRIEMRRLVSMYIEEAKYANLSVDFQDMGRINILMYVSENNFREVRIDFLQWCILNPNHYENNSI
jgi:hypothetical protein